MEDDQALEAALEILRALNCKQSLPASERSRRTRLTLETLCLRKGLSALAQEARGWSAELKTAVARFLPNELRRLVYGGVSAGSTVTMPEPATDTKGVDQSAANSGKKDVPHFRTVLLLGAQPDHEFNDQHLRRHQFDPLRVDRPEQLGDLLNETVCAVVIAKSWWATLPPNEHLLFLEKILQHSTFTWVKIDETGCMPSFNHLAGTLPLDSIC